MPAYPPIRRLAPDAVADLAHRAELLAKELGSAENPDLVAQAPQLAADLHPGIAQACRPPGAADGVVVLRGLPVDESELGLTPPHWSATSDSPLSAQWSITLLLLASVLGRAFGWAGQQAGRLVHDIVPSPGHEHEQTGMSSTVLLSPHSEDAFHPRRAHLLMLACLRNPDRVPTHASCVRRATLDQSDVDVLSTPTVPILPDDSYGDAAQFADAPPPVPTLWRRDDGLCLRFDPAYTPLGDADPAYQSAYARLSAALEAATVPVVLEPGDVLLIDNDTVVHGRAPFRARYDGTDRWLKRVNVRVPDRYRPEAEDAESGYGQQLVNPYQ